MDIDSSELILEEVIGSGNFSIVRKAQYCSKPIAVKLLTSKMNPKIVKEIEVYRYGKLLCLTVRTTNHPHIVHFFGVTKLKERDSDPWLKYGLVLELMDVSLYDYIHVKKANLTEIQRYFKLNI